jgi:hypothetical protein
MEALIGAIAKLFDVFLHSGLRAWGYEFIMEFMGLSLESYNGGYGWDA